MSIQVIGAGFGRTGTTSLKAALEILDLGPCFHMTELQWRPWRARLWLKAAQGEPVDWSQVLAGYRSAVDWPTCAFYAELIERYPDARVVLTVRDPAAWYESARTTIYAIAQEFPRWLNRLIPPLGTVWEMVDAVVWDGTFQGRFHDSAHAQRVFRQHQAAVEAAVPSERLLVYDVSEGWGPLCRFLDRPVPTGVPFPRCNEAKVMQRQVRWAARFNRIVIGVGLTTLAIALCLWWGSPCNGLDATTTGPESHGLERRSP